MKDPLDKIQWLLAEDLKQNSWNPNAVPNPELKLLADSILTYGWIQPIIVSRDHLIIDGFHRWRLSTDHKAIFERYVGLVPCAVLDVDEREAMIMTVAINRAKGTAVAIRMSSLVKRLVDDHGMSREELAKRIRGTKREVDALYEDSVWKDLKLDRHTYSPAWVPYEDGKKRRDG